MNSATAAGDHGGDGTAVVAVLRNECATLAEPTDAVRLGNRQQKDRQEGRARHPALNAAGSEVIGVPAKARRLSPVSLVARRSTIWPSPDQSRHSRTSDNFLVTGHSRAEPPPQRRSQHQLILVGPLGTTWAPVWVPNHCH